MAVLAMGIGGILMLARHSDDWTASQDHDAGGLSGYRKLALVMAEPFRRLEWQVYDFMHTFGRKTPGDPDVVVLGIDEASLALEDSSAFPEDIAASRPLQLMDEVFPWSREVYAHVIDRLVEAGAKTIVIDLMFPAESGRYPEGDEVLRECLERNREHVVLAADIIAADVQNGVNESILFPYDGLIAHRWPPDERIGFVSYWPDTDGVIRQARFRYQQDPVTPERSLLSFGAAALRMEGMGERIPADTRLHQIRFGDAENYPPVSLHEIFVPDLWQSNYGNGAFFAGKTVFLGTVARQQQDFHPTPVGKIAGVRIHAHVYAALKAGELIRQPPSWFAPASIALAAFLAWLMLAMFRRPLLATILLFAGVAGALFGQVLMLTVADMVVHSVTPAMAFGLIGICGFTFDYFQERQQKHALKRSIMRFHSPDVAEQIVQHPETYYSIRQGASRCIVVLFSDIRGYTSMSEQMTAQEMVTQLNEYFERMVSAVFRHNGAVDKFIGDAMMAVWGRFRDHPDEAALQDDARNAVASALVMRGQLEELNASWRARNMAELAIGIGLHQGEAVVGEIGSQERAELTAIGDSVNLGSRLEGATKEYGLDLLISAAVEERVRDTYLCRSVDLLRVKGKQLPVEVFAVLGKREQTSPAGLDSFERGMAHYRAGRFAEAVGCFGEAKLAGLDDELTGIFLERSIRLFENPPEKWDGVYTMTKK